MSEFKYACPHCGQHIQCDAAQSGTTMECPTCFQKIIAPQSPASSDPKFILTGIKIPKHPRPVGGAGLEALNPAVAKKQFPIAAVVAGILVVVAMAAAIVFRGKLFSPRPSSTPPSVPSETRMAASPSTPSAVAATVSDPRWKLDLAEAVLPDAAAAGRIAGKDFSCERATLQGGLLNLRQGGGWPPALGVSIYLHAVRSSDLAGQTVNITTNLPVVPRVILRSKNDQQQAVTQNFTAGYALRIEFAQLAGNRLPGKIYLVMPDEMKSCVVGSFTAEIIPPKPPKQPAKQPSRRKP